MRPAAVLAAALVLGSPSTAEGPSGLALPGFTLHVRVSEELDPDRLNGLVRPGVVLWVSTRSNVLRSSLVERLGRFGEAYVRMRAPLPPRPGLGGLGLAPRAGVWLDLSDAPPPGTLGARPIALEVDGAWTPETSSRVQALRPTRVLWRPTGLPSLEEWGRFAQAQATREVRLGGALLKVWAPCQLPWPLAHPRLFIEAALGELPALPPCGARPLFRVAPPVDGAVLARALAAEPSSELSVEVGDDSDRALAAASLLDRLREGP